MKLSILLSLSSLLVGSLIPQQTEAFGYPAGCVVGTVQTGDPAPFNHEEWFGTSEITNQEEKDSGYQHCPDGEHITSWSAATVNQHVVGIKCTCSDGSTFETKASTSWNQAVAPTLPATTPVAPEGFDKLDLYGGEKNGLQGMKVQSGTIQLIIGLLTGSPWNCLCPPGYKFAGFRIIYADFCHRIQFVCCPKKSKPSSTGPAYVVSSSTGPGSGGSQQSSLPPPVIDSSTAPPGVTGDPQIIGFLGQSFQVHGMDQTIYNIISTAKLQFNALFVYLNKGECRQGTLCFSHPGNYFGAVGLAIKDESGKTTKLQLTAGPVKEGMKVTVDNQEVLPSQKHLEIDGSNKIFFPTPFELYIETPEFSVKFENSDMFLNQQVTINQKMMQLIANYKSQQLMAAEAEGLPHGILGQTWQRKEYNNRWKFIEGQLFDYIVSDGIDGTSFKYNRFKATN